MDIFAAGNRRGDCVVRIARDAALHRGAVAPGGYGTAVTERSALRRVFRESGLIHSDIAYTFTSI
jgi:hypothetical protein